MRRRAGALVVLTALMASTTAPAAGQTGTDAPSVAFLAQGPDFHLRLHTAAPDGSDPQRVSDEPVNHSLFRANRRSVPEWRPDGSGVLVSVDNEDEGTSVVEVPLDGGPLRTLVPDALDPALSPDGARLAFRSGHAGLGTSGSDGSGVETFEPGTAVIGPPFWNAEGDRLLFLGAAPESESDYGMGALYEVGVDGTGLQRVTPPDLVVTDVEVAEDGRAAFVASQEPDLDSPRDAYVYDPAAAEPVRRVTDVAASGGVVRTAALSPTGELAFTVGADSRAREHDVRLADAGSDPGPGRTVATIAAHDPYFIDWSDDGHALAVTGELFDSEDGWAAYLVDPAGGEARPLAPSYSDGATEEEVYGPRGAVFAPSTPPLVGATRYSGRNRFETAAVLTAEIPSEEPRTAILARADDYADALAAAPLARAFHAPVVLTGSDRLHEVAASVLEGRERVILVGNEVALSARVADDVRAVGVPTVERIAGNDRFDTARLLGERLASETGGCERAYLAVGRSADPARGWPDAVAVAGLAAAEGAPVLLTDADSLPSATRDALAQCATATVVGGTAAVTEQVRSAAEEAVGRPVDRVAGVDRYATSAALAGRIEAPRTVWLATGENWPDALAAGPAVAANDGVLLIVPGGQSRLPDSTVDALRALPPVSALFAVGDATVLQ